MGGSFIASTETITQALPRKVSATAVAAARLVSLDVFRGMTIAGMILEQPGELEPHLLAARARGMERLDTHGHDLSVFSLYRGCLDDVFVCGAHRAWGDARAARAARPAAQRDHLRHRAVPERLPVLSPFEDSHPRRAPTNCRLLFRWGTHRAGNAAPRRLRARQPTDRARCLRTLCAAGGLLDAPDVCARAGLRCRPARPGGQSRRVH